LNVIRKEATDENEEHVEKRNEEPGALSRLCDEHFIGGDKSFEI
jgi:hypothetical protein